MNDMNSFPPSHRPDEQNKTQPTTGNPYPQSSHSGASYTWTTANQTPPGSPYPPQGYRSQSVAVQPRKNHTGVKLAAALLACLLISAASIGGFAYLINQGYVRVQSDSSGEERAAFTINRIIRQEVSPENMSTDISLLTPQEVADRVIPSVVCIQVFSKTNGNSIDGYGFFANEPSDISLTPISQGSGIIYNKEGYVITNAHVIAGDQNLKVITHDGETYEAEVIGADSATDLAVIKIKGGGEFTPAEFGSSDGLKVADSVMAIGNPGGIALNSTVTMGYVSALDREVTSPEQNAYALKYIQTDAAINPGNSGGALVNLYGQVIGINTAKISQSGYEGLGFAIPTDAAQPVISNLMEFGYVKDRAMIGITFTYIDEITARFNGLDASGLFVQGLTTENAKASGLSWGDLITGIEGTEITSTSTVTSVLAQKKPGDTVSLAVLRPATGESLTIEVILSENSGQTLPARK